MKIRLCYKFESFNVVVRFGRSFTHFKVDGLIPGCYILSAKASLGNILDPELLSYENKTYFYYF